MSVGPSMDISTYSTTDCSRQRNIAGREGGSEGEREQEWESEQASERKSQFSLNLVSSIVARTLKAISNILCSTRWMFHCFFVFFFLLQLSIFFKSSFHWSYLSFAYEGRRGTKKHNFLFHSAPPWISKVPLWCVLLVRCLLIKEHSSVVGVS